MEFTIEVADHQRGQSTPFRLEARQPDGQWATVHKGDVYGTIYAKRFPAARAEQVRLVIEAPVTQFDLFPPGL